MKQARFLVLTPLLLAGCSRIDSLTACCPEITPAAWNAARPFTEVSLGGLRFILNEPFSSFLVFALGILTISIGVHFLRTRGNERSRLWWGIGLFFWGAAAILAGTSYQALSYEIKCAGREACAWTSWWEIWYMLFQAVSMNALVTAVAWSSTTGKLKKGLITYALVNGAAYWIIALTGALLPSRFMISFELMVLFTSPAFVLLFIINAVRYLKYREPMEGALMTTWLLQGVVIALYYAYLMMGFTEALWRQGLWFSANDVLHLLLIGWMTFIALGVVKQVKDRRQDS